MSEQLTIEVAKSADVPFPPPLDEGVTEEMHSLYIATPPPTPSPEVCHILQWSIVFFSHWSIVFLYLVTDLKILYYQANPAADFVCKLVYMKPDLICSYITIIYINKKLYWFIKKNTGFNLQPVVMLKLKTGLSFMDIYLHLPRAL